MSNLLSATHKCSEHLRFISVESVEPHGERHTDEGYKCSVCGEIYDVDDPPQDEEGAVKAEIPRDEMPPATESRFTSDGYYRRKIGYDESRADDGDVTF